RDARVRGHFAPGWVPPEHLNVGAKTLEETNIAVANVFREIRTAARVEMALPQDLWKGQTVFIVGGGPSLIKFDLDRLRGHIVIVCNSTAMGCRGMGATLFFIDDAWAMNHHELVETWDGLVITTARAAKLRWLTRIYLAEQFSSPGFIVGERPKITRGRSSGHVAICLAAGLQASRIVLLGFDMRNIHGRSHWHS